jgi:hypothetical protein
MALFIRPRSRVPDLFDERPGNPIRPDVESELIQVLRKYGVEYDARYIWGEVKGVVRPLQGGDVFCES